MEQNEGILIKLTAEGIDRYCRDLSRHLSKVNKRIAVVDALKTFLSVMTDPGEQSKQEFILIRETLQKYIDKCGVDLQEEYAQSLILALRKRQISGMTNIYQWVSRDGFWRLLTRVAAKLGEEESCEISGWCQQWLADVRERSQKASPYPDSVDFNVAGVDVAEYMVMADTAKYFLNE